MEVVMEKDQKKDKRPMALLILILFLLPMLFILAQFAAD